LFSLPPVCHEMSQFVQSRATYHDVQPHHGPRSNRAKWPEIETSKTISQNKLFLFEVDLCQAFCHSNGKLTQYPT
jgi:hypothetical protein